MRYIDRLAVWMSKGELCYRSRADGCSWMEIRRICPDAMGMAMRWAERNGEAWPVVVDDRGDGTVVVDDVDDVVGDLRVGTPASESERHWEPCED